MPADALYCPYCGVSQKPTRTMHKRGNGTGNVYKRGQTWTARVVIGWNGKNPIWRTKGGFKTKKDAINYIPSLKAIQGSLKGSVPTLIKYWTTYESVKLPALSKPKQGAYRIAWKKLAELHYMKVDTIGVNDVMRVVQRVAPTYYTARDCKTLLTRLFELAAADGWCSKDIPSFIELPKLKERERRPFTDAEQAALWILYESGDRRAAIPLLMIYTGMMPGEAQTLKVEHIQLDSLEIVGVGMKTDVRKASPIVIPRDILPLVEDLVANAQPNGFIWTRNEDKWYADYYAALEAAECRRLEPYCCRHTTATRLAISEGIAPQTIQRMMRWSTSKMLDRYAHPDSSDVHDAADSIKRYPTPQDGEYHAN